MLRASLRILNVRYTSAEGLDKASHIHFPKTKWSPRNIMLCMVSHCVDIRLCFPAAEEDAYTYEGRNSDHTGQSPVLQRIHSETIHDLDHPGLLNSVSHLVEEVAQEHSYENVTEW